MISDFCKILGVKEADVLGRSRVVELTIPRHIYFWILYKSGYTYAEIGRLNNRCHATIHHSIQLVNSAIEVNDRSVLDIWDKVKTLRCTKTGIRAYQRGVCPYCLGKGRVILFEDYLGLEAPEYGICEHCNGENDE